MKSHASYNATTGIYKSKMSSVFVPDNLSIFDFIFDYQPKAKGYGYSNPSPVVVGRRPWSIRKDETMLIDAKSGYRLTHGQARDRVEDISRVFVNRYDLQRNDCLAVFASNSSGFACSIWAAHRGLAVVSCANPAYGVEELSFQLQLVGEHFKVKVLLVDVAGLAVAIKACENLGLDKSIIVLDLSPSETAPDLANGIPTIDSLIDQYKSTPLAQHIRLDAGEAKTTLAFLSFSSGTTGRPKAVQIPHASVIANVLQYTHHWNESGGVIKPYNTKAGTGDAVVAVLPFFHIYGLIVVLHASCFMETPVVTLRKFELSEMLSAIQRYKLTILYAVPPIIILMIKNPIVANYDLSSLRVSLSGAAPLSKETAAAFIAKFPGCLFCSAYGMTETATVVCLSSALHGQAGIPVGSAGVVLPNIELKVVNTEGKAVGFDQLGELWSRSPSNAIGYLANQKATSETFYIEGNSELNFVRTGDEVYIDKRGEIFVVDRIKELIKVSGNQVAPAELEGHLLQHPSIVNCCVIGVPEDFTGEAPVAFVALNPDAIAAIAKDSAYAQSLKNEIKKFVSDNKIKYKWLSEVIFIDAIPQTASGKLLRKDLRVLYARLASEGKEKL